MASEPDRRLHPLSIVFIIGGRVKDLLIPIVIALFATRSDKFRLIGPAVTAVVVVAAAIVEYLSYRYRYDDDDLVVRTGVFTRNERHIPYSRIQNIDAVQNALHRMFDVAIVQVQTGSGSEPEATLRVLPLGDLAEMRRRVQAERQAAAAEAHPEMADDLVVPVEAPPSKLLHLPSRELLLAGFIENRGMALVLAAIGLMSQLDAPERFFDSLEERAPEWVPQGLSALGAPASFAFGAVVVILAALVFVRVLSTVWAVVRLHDYTLVRDGDDFRVQYGLFTRVTSTIPLRRIQTISIHQGWLHRKLGRAGIQVTTAGASGVPGADQASSSREWLAPIIPIGDVRALVHQMDPELELDGIDWTPVHPRAALRIARVTLLRTLPAIGLAIVAIGWGSIAVAALLAVWVVAWARGITKVAGCAIVGARVAFRSGWLNRVVSITRFERIQSASYYRSLWDRRTGMASVSVDSAGVGSAGLRMKYLPDDVALRLHATLSRAAAQTPFTW